LRQPMNVLLTGGTGFLGEYLLVELLRRGHSVWALYRNESKKLDTIRFLSSLGLPLSADSLHWIKGEVLEAEEQWETWCRQNEGLDDVDTLLHSAASTRLHLDETGEPIKTNVGSAKVLSRLLDRKPMKPHVISTAYVCGFVGGRRIYEVNHPRGDFVTVYEESKWEAEQIWTGHATILRPGVIIGHSETARCTSFSGWYILFQSLHLLDRLLRDTRDSNRRNLEIDVPSDPEGTTNIIPVDYVARATVRIMENPSAHNEIYHLTHPSPPPHRWTLDYIRRKFDLSGFRLIGEGAPFTQPRNAAERMVWRQLQTILLHFSNNPAFDRSHTDAALPDLEVPPITEALVDKLVDYAIEQDWGQSQK